MAAIISQMAANKRARQKRGKRLVPPDKSVYTLPPFDPCFDPMLHNKYIKSVALKTNKLGIRHFTTTTHIARANTEAKIYNLVKNKLIVVFIGAMAIIFLLCYGITLYFLY